MGILGGGEEYKQCIVVRDDIKLSRGKTAVQAAHAAILAYNNAGRTERSRWMNSGQKKVALKVGTLEELRGLERKARKVKIPCAIVVDAGLTEVPPGTVTALGIGPAKSSQLDAVVGHLKLL